MEIEINPYIVYVKTNSNGYITAINSSAFLSDTTGWIKIDEGYGDKYHHAQGNYLDKPIINERGIYCYKLVDGVVEEHSQEEMDVDVTEETPSQMDRIEAQVTYTAMMTDTLLEV